MSARKRSLCEQYVRAVIFAAAVISPLIAGFAWGQDFKRPDGSVPLPMDWSDQHLIYTVGFGREQASKMQGDPRYFIQTRSHRKALEDKSADIGFPTLGKRSRPGSAAEWSRKRKPEMKRDWSVSLGPTAGVAAGSWPAKFSFDVNAAPSCTADYAVFPINASTGSSRADVVGTFSITTQYASGTTVSVTVTPTVGTAATLTLTASTTLNTGTDFEVFTTGTVSTNATTEAGNLAAAINRNLGANALDRVVAVASANTVSVYTLTPGTRVVLTDANNLNNFSWGAVTAGANGTQANLAGFNHLYSGSGTPLCSGLTFPEFIFSYASGVGPVATSPVLSLDGTKIAYIENSSHIGAVLHVLTFGSGSTEYGACSNTGAALPTCATAAVIPGSSAGSTATDFMLPLGLVTKAIADSDTYSSPFVNYSDDTLYVGDDSGYLFSVTGVFHATTPAHSGGNFPVAVSGNLLSSPVEDVSGTGDIFVGDSLSDVYDYTSAGALLGTSISIGNSTNGGIRAGAVVDSTNSKVYFTTVCSGAGGTQQLAQFPFNSGGLGTPVKTTLPGSGTEGCTAGAGAQYGPAPDNDYYTEGIASASAASNGHLVVCYEAAAAVNLTQFGFASGSLQTTAQFDISNSVPSATTCSPISEFEGDDIAYSISAVTQSGNTVTVTTSTNVFFNSEVVTIAGVTAGSGGCTGAAVADINGERTITVTSNTKFTFTSPLSTTIASGCGLGSATATGPTQDYLFAGTSQSSVSTLTLPVTSNTQAALATNLTSATGGTSGIIVDNDSSAGQASSIYFGTQATSTSQCGATAAYCAVKLTQAGLN